MGKGGVSDGGTGVREMAEEEREVVTAEDKAERQGRKCTV